MKPSIPLLFVLAIFTLPKLLQAGEKVLIDTDFSKTGKDQAPQAEPPIDKKSGFPMKVPSSHLDTVFAELPSTVRVSQEEMNNLQPPFAVVTIKKKRPEDILPRQGPFGSAGLSWNFRNVPQGAGKYEVTWTLLSITDVSSLMMGVGLSHQNEDKTLTNVEAQLHPTQWPLTLILTKTLLISCDEHLQLKPGKAHEFKMDFDLNKNTWGMEVDGKKFFRNKSFPKEYLAEFPTFVATHFGFGGGATDEMDGATYAVARVKMIKLDDDGTE